MVQILLTNRLPCMLMIIGQLLWLTCATHLPTPAVPWLMLNSTAISSVVTRLSLLDLLFTVLVATLTGLPFWCKWMTFCVPSWNISTNPYTLPWPKQLSAYRNFVLLLISEGFSPSDDKKTNNAWLFFTVQVNNWMAMLYVLLHSLVLLDRHNPVWHIAKEPFCVPK